MAVRFGGVSQQPAGSGTGSVTNVSVVTANGVSGSVANPTSTPAITLTLGDITPNSIGYVTPGSNLSGTGPTTASFNAGATITAMDLCYLSSTSTWLQADATTAATSSGMLALSLQSKTIGQAMNVALPGSFVRNDAWAWTPGVPLYSSKTPAAITATQPATTDSVIRVIGFAMTAAIIFFNPSPDYITHV